MSDTTRGAVYGVVTAVVALLSGQGWGTAEESAADAEAAARALAAAAMRLAAVKTVKRRGGEAGDAHRWDPRTSGRPRCPSRGRGRFVVPSGRHQRIRSGPDPR